MNLAYNKINSIDVFEKGDFSKLESLDLSYNEIKNLRSLMNLTNIKRIFLKQNKIDDVDGIQYLKNASIIDLSECGINSIESLRNINLPKLEKLYLNNNNIEDISPLNGLKSLSTLDLSNNKIKNIDEIKNLKSIYYVSLGPEEIASLEKSEIIKKPKLNSSEEAGDSVENKANNYYDKEEDENYIYYSTKEGISKVNKNNGESKLILKVSNVYGITLSEGKLYFILNTKDGEDSGIFCIDTNGKNYEQIFHIKQPNTGMRYNISNFLVKGGTLYLSSTLQLYAYNMNTKKLK